MAGMPLRNLWVENRFIISHYMYKGTELLRYSKLWFFQHWQFLFSPENFSTPFYLILLFWVILRNYHSVFSCLLKLCRIVRVSLGVMLSRICVQSFYLEGATILFFVNTSTFCLFSSINSYFRTAISGEFISIIVKNQVQEKT